MRDITAVAQQQLKDDACWTTQVQKLLQGVPSPRATWQLVSAQHTDPQQSFPSFLPSWDLGKKWHSKWEAIL